MKRATRLIGTGIGSVVVARVMSPWASAVGAAALFAGGYQEEAGLALLGALAGLSHRSSFAGPVVPGGSVLSSYGNRRTSNGGTQFHLGEDLRAPEGTDVLAAASGTVVGAYSDGRLSGYGNTVVIAHDDGMTAALYAHMKEIDDAMRVGTRVDAGQRVGAVGHTNSAGGFASSPDHLHLEILVATDGDPQRSFTHFYGGPNWYPDRVDPQVWAAEHGVALVG